MHRVAVLALVFLGLLLAGCEGEPGSGALLEVDSRYLGLPHRAGPRDSELELELTAHLKAPARSISYQSPDSLRLMTTGQPLRISAALVDVPARDVYGVRFTWRGTLGGEVGLSWRERRAVKFRRAIAGAKVPGQATATTVEIGFGPTRTLGTRIDEIGIELPPTEVGPVTLSNVQLLLRPARVLHRVDMDGAVREVIAPGPGGWMEWDVVVPADGRLTFDYGTRPEFWINHGDGSRFVVEVYDQEGATVLMDRWLSPFAVPEHRAWQVADLDLGDWVGRRVVIRLSTRAGPDAHGIFPASAQARDDAPLFTVPRVVSERDGRPSVLLIVIDTLRRDALGGEASPALDSLAARGARFDRAWAAGSWTHPSTVSLLSGWRPSQHRLGFGPAGTTRLDPATPMIASEFRDAGWATAAVSNNRIVSVEEGFAKGVVAFDESALTDDQIFGAERVARSARSWLQDHAGAPFFLYLHFFDPHDRYQAPPPFTRMHVDPESDRQIEDSSVRGGRVNTFVPGSAEVTRDLDDRELEYLRDLYRGEVSYVDHWIGWLLADLEAAGRLENTVVVVTSDHGEEFREHGGLKHGHSLYDELVAVPLIVRRPGDAGAGRISEQPVSLLDLPATLRSLAGLSARAGDMPWSFEPDAPSTPLLAENWRYGDGATAGPQRSIVRWPLKMILYDGGRSELFDLAADPGELSPLDDDERTARMVAILDSIAGEIGAAIIEAPVDPDLLQKLEAMGYVH